jgi:hypothetical protein
MDFYNGRRPHSSLDGTTPDHAYFTALPLGMAAYPADAPLIDAENLFRQPEPPQLSRITSFVTLLVSIVGLGAIVISYRTLKQADTSARVSAYQQMVSQSAGVEKLLVEHSAMRPYFRDRKPLTRGDKDYDLGPQSLK